MKIEQMLRPIACVLIAGLSVAVVATATASDEGQAAAAQVTEATYRYFLGDNEGVEGILYTHAGDRRGVGDPDHDLALDATNSGVSEAEVQEVEERLQGEVAQLELQVKVLQAEVKALQPGGAKK